MKIGVVIPCYNVRDHVLGVIKGIGSEISKIYVVDDACPQKSGELVRDNVSDTRVRVIFHEKNQGVGGAVISGYKAALKDELDVVIKIDGDGQMNPMLAMTIAKPVLEGRADYSKGNRFDSLENLISMPKMRIFGNAILSLFSKVSSGYWSITDPTNGYTAIHRKALESLNLDKLRRTYFFESDLLFRLSLSNSVVADVPMVAVYGDEKVT